MRTLFQRLTVRSFDNLLLNPSFEIDGTGSDDDKLANWSEAGGTPVIVLDTTTFKTGTRSVKLEHASPGPGVGQGFDVTPGHVYRASCWVRGEGTGGVLNTGQVAFYDVTNAEYVSVDGTVWHNTGITSQDWGKYTIDVTAPVGCVRLAVFLSHPQDPGIAWFDEVSVVDLDEEPSWEDLEDIVVDPAPVIEYGMIGTDVEDLVAETGVLTFALDNGPSNSEGKAGLYSPDHANALYGFGIGTQIRVFLDADAEPLELCPGGDAEGAVPGQLMGLKLDQIALPAGVDLRKAWFGTQVGDERNIYTNVVTEPGDFLVVWHFKNSNSSNDTTYTYDGTAMTKVGEYARGAASEISLFYHDPGANVGAKTVHIYQDNGHPHSVCVAAFTGVKMAAPVLDTGSYGLYYSTTVANVSETAEDEGGIAIGFHAATSAVGDLSFPPWELALDQNDDGASQRMWWKQCDSDPETGSFKRLSGDADSSGYAISLARGVDTFVARYAGTTISLDADAYSGDFAFLVTDDDEVAEIDGVYIQQAVLALSGTGVVLDDWFLPAVPVTGASVTVSLAAKYGGVGDTLSGSVKVRTLDHDMVELDIVEEAITDTWAEYELELSLEGVTYIQVMVIGVSEHSTDEGSAEVYADDFSVLVSPAPKFVGRISDIAPATGLYDEQIVEVVCQDWMQFAAKQEIGSIPMMQDAGGDEILERAMQQFPSLPRRVSFEQGVETFALGLDSDDHDDRMRSLFHKIARSEMGRIYLHGDGTLVFENRDLRQKKWTPDFTLDGLMVAMAPEYSDRQRYNIVQAHIRPVEVGNDPVRLWKHPVAPNSLAIPPGETIVVVCKFTDPVSRQAVGGLEVVNPVANTEFGSRADNVSNDMAVFLEQSNEVGARSMIARLTNTHPGKTGYVNDFQVMGKPVYAFDPVVVEAADDEDVAREGALRFKLTLDQISRAETAKAYAQYVLNVLSDVGLRGIRLSFLANQSEELLEAAVGAEVSTRLRVIESISGVDRGFFVNRLKYTIEGELLWVDVLAVAAPEWNTFVWDASEWDNPDNARRGL